MTETEAKLVNPVVLAFLGDAVYSLWVRERLVQSGAGKAADFQRAAAKLVSARGQSAFLEKVLPLFTPTEEDIFRRGRNAKKPTKSKSATAAEYNRSTGFEAVLGFLHLTGNAARIEELLSLTDSQTLKGQAAEQVYKP
ncbi:MAG: Mini-ribonuclease 3 [Clostridia bacterium]|nr:Mini-ribonuclease 3 [Clostridia bacterium]